MQIKFLGTGGAFDIDYLNSAAKLHFRGKHILIDCGFTVFQTLVHKNLIQRVDHIILTHLHNDHCGSLPTLLLYKSIIEKSPRPVILYPSEQFKEQLYTLLELQLKTPDKYAEFVPLEQYTGISAIDTYGQHSENMQTYAYVFDEDEDRIAYSGDLGKPETLFDRLDKMPPLRTCVFHEVTFNAENTGHTYYKKLLPYISKYEIFGYHCDPTQYPLYDFTISALTAGPSNPKDEPNTLRMPGTLVLENNFAIVSVNGPASDRRFKVTIYNTKGAELWQKELKASELK